MNNKLYFVTNSGDVLKYHLVTRDEWGNRCPQGGCDILIRDMRGHVSSANSRRYYPTKREALEAFIADQAEFVAAAENRASREKQIMAYAQKQLEECK